MIDIDEILKGKINDSSNQLENSIINLREKIQEAPMCISIGQDYFGNPAPVMTMGNISCLTGLGKSKKTFFKSAVVSAYMGSEWHHIIGHRSTDKYIIDIDTEQSRFHCQKVFRRTEKMAGIYKNYIPMSLREYEPQQRLQIIEAAIEKFKGNIGLIVIDGFADLLNDFNNLEESNLLVNKLMKWSTEQNCHITGILHLNPSQSNRKAMGHIGSMVIRKAETVFQIIANDLEPRVSKVLCDFSRNVAFDEFNFRISDQGLPYKV